MKPTDPSFPLPKTTFLQSLGKFIVEYLQWRQGMSSPLWKLWLWCIRIQGTKQGSHQPHKYLSMCNVLSQLFMCSGNDVAIFRQTTLENHVFGGTHICEQGMGRFVIVPYRRRGDNASFCCSWNPTSSNVNTSSQVRFVPPFTCHTLGLFGQWNIHFFLLPFTHQLMSCA